MPQLTAAPPCHLFYAPQAQAHLTASRTENEDTRQRLAAAVRVRQFLVERLAEGEGQGTAAKEDKERVLAQAASDREVMTFLDDRVRELEEGARQSAAEIARLKQHVVDARGTHTSKAKVLEEMVRMATAQRHDAEAQFKSQKKLLVKEIKTLRAAVASLQVRDAAWWWPGGGVVASLRVIADGAWCDVCLGGMASCSGTSKSA